MAHLYIMRHGEPVRPECAFYTGSGGNSFFCPLTPLGREQVRRTAEKLPAFGFEALYASPVLRTLETAGYAAQELGLPIHLDHRLREVDYGEYEMLNPDQVMERWPTLEPKRRLDPYHFQFPGGETLEQVAGRALPALEEIDRRHSGPVLVVAHAALTFACMWKSGKNQTGSFYNSGFQFARICDFTNGRYLEEL